MIKDLAPIALFVYNRLDNAQKTIDTLKQNIYASDSILYIFSDGGKDNKSWKEVNQLRAYLKTINGFREVHVVERVVNYYLERNLIEGITQIINEYGKIIMLEDDVCTSPYFLKYMNEALSLYVEEKQIMHIAAFTTLKIEGKGDTYFTPHMAGTAWGTWKDRWDHFTHYKTKEEALKNLTNEDINKIEYGGVFKCLQSLNKVPIPWDICWYLTIYKHKGLCLSPTSSIVHNTGLYRGTHFHHYKILGKYCFDRECCKKDIKIDRNKPIAKDEEIEAMYPIIFKDHGMRYTLLGKFIRYFYLKYFKRQNR